MDTLRYELVGKLFFNTPWTGTVKDTTENIGCQDNSVSRFVLREPLYRRKKKTILWATMNERGSKGLFFFQ